MKGKSRRLLVSVRGIGLVVVLASGTVGEARAAPGLDEPPPPGVFVPADVPLSGLNIRDIGVTDVDADGVLDVFTVNHSAPDQILIGDGAGGFTDRRDELRLGNDPRFAPVGSDDPDPVMPGPGVMLFWRGNVVTIVVEGAVSSAPAQVAVDVLSAVSVAADGIEPSVEETTVSDGVVSTSVRFSAASDGSVELTLAQVSVPVMVEIEPGPERDVFVGATAEPAPGRRFRVWVGRDRHAAVWADVIGGGRTEAVYVRGGLSGRMASYPITFFEEMRVWDRDRYIERGPSRGLKARGCSAHSVSAVDLTGDGRLDLHVTCSHRQRDLIYVQVDDFRFRERARSLNLELTGAKPHVWLDLDLDGDQDLIRASGSGVYLYENAGASFERRRLVRRPREATPRALATGDLDGDGDTDVLLAAKGSSVLLRNVGNGRLVKVGASETGLPRALLDVSTVDYDSDGRLDVYAAPGGLYRQSPGGRFVSVPGLVPEPSDLVDAHAVWFDADGDGRRDLLRASLTGDREFPRRWTVEFFLNRVESGHWLQIDLAGPKRNRSAVGARVRVKGPWGSRAFRVGDSDGSRVSQGHHRIYVGLGSYEGVSKIVVRWSDGSRTVFTPRSVDRRLTLRHQGSSFRSTT